MKDQKLTITYANVDILVGKNTDNDNPMLVLNVNSGQLSLGFSISEAQQLGTAILMSCGVSIERFTQATTDNGISSNVDDSDGNNNI